MLNLVIDPRDAAGSWAGRSGAYAAGRSRISCHRHPSLEDFHLTDGRRHLIVVRERASGFSAVPPGQTTPDAYDTAKGASAAWPLDHIMVEFADHEMTLAAGSFGTAPTYLTVAGDGTLRGSWDYAEVAAAAPATKPNRLALVRQLTYWYRYSHATPLSAVLHLTERSRARFRNGALVLEYPPPAPHALPRRLRPDADPIGGFDRLLEAVIAARPFDPTTVAVELSGGQDSAAVAATLGDRHPGLVRTCAMLIPGRAGDQQRRRRGELRRALRLGADITVEARRWPPGHPACARARGLLVPPQESLYSEAEAQLFERVAAAGVRMMWTGVGGDELMALRPWESPRPLDAGRRHPLWLTPEALEILEAGEDAVAPASLVSEVTLMATASAAPLYLRRGLWPVSPLAHPDVITFGEWLPVEWRRRKRLLRERLIRRGLPGEVAYPPLRESLAEVLTSGLQRWGLDLLEQLGGDCRLVDLGLVDADALRAAVRRTRAAAVRETDHPLFRVIAVEQFLRALN